ncbi:hypothetical protein D3C81_1782860 [compost metagenome]
MNTVSPPCHGFKRTTDMPKSASMAPLPSGTLMPQADHSERAVSHSPSAVAAMAAFQCWAWLNSSASSIACRLCRSEVGQSSRYLCTNPCM